jgi:hypothetical protein
LLSRLSFVTIVTVAITASAFAQDFNSESTFVAALNSNYYNELFNEGGWANGNLLTPPWAAPGNGTFDWNANVTFGNLYELTGALSTDANTDWTVSFSNSATPVYAFGGIFNATNTTSNDFDQFELEFSNGHNENLTNSSGNDFYGYISTTALTSVTFHRLTSTDFISIADVYTGIPVATPEPFSIAGFGVAGLALLRRRRLRRNGIA